MTRAHIHALSSARLDPSSRLPEMAAARYAQPTWAINMGFKFMPTARANCGLHDHEPLDRRHVIFGKQHPAHPSLLLRVSWMRPSEMVGQSTSLATVQTYSRKESIRRSLGTKGLFVNPYHDPKGMIRKTRSPLRPPPIPFEVVSTRVSRQALSSLPERKLPVGLNADTDTDTEQNMFYFGWTSSCT